MSTISFFVNLFANGWFTSRSASLYWSAIAANFFSCWLVMSELPFDAYLASYMWLTLFFSLMWLASIQVSACDLDMLQKPLCDLN